MVIDIIFHLTIGLLAAGIAALAKHLVAGPRRQWAIAVMFMVVEAYLSVKLVG